MKLSNIPNIKHKKKRRVGRGYGSGRAKTAGRGSKGQKARSKVKKGFEGGQIPLIKRVPYLRGKGRNRSTKPNVYPLDVRRLEALPSKTTVTRETLIKHNIIDKNINYVKVLGKHKLSKQLTVKLPCSAGAKDAIHKAGGKVISS